MEVMHFSTPFFSHGGSNQRLQPRACRIHVAAIQGFDDPFERLDAAA
jgi:hypothetical protein